MSMDKLAIIYIFASDYHSGQASRGYKLACHISRHIKDHDRFVGVKIWHTARATQLYKTLVKKYADKM